MRSGRRCRLSNQSLDFEVEGEIPIPPVGRFAKRIAFHRRAALRLRKVALRRHLRAVVLGRRALAAKARGQNIRARRLLRRALMMKAAAVRARMRARLHSRTAISTNE